MDPLAYWALNVRMVVVGTRESRLGPDRLRGEGSDARPITGEPGKWLGRAADDPVGGAIYDREDAWVIAGNVDRGVRPTSPERAVTTAPPAGGGAETSG